VSSPSETSHFRKRPRKCSCSCAQCECDRRMVLKKSRSSSSWTPMEQDDQPLLVQIEEENTGCNCGCGQCVIEEYVDLSSEESKGIFSANTEGAYQLGKDKIALYLSIEGMTCGGCVGMVTTALTSVAGNLLSIHFPFHNSYIRCRIRQSLIK